MSPAAATNPVAPRSIILFQQVDVVRAKRASDFHRHDFWQLEWNREGTWDLQTHAATTTLAPGDVVFFPPGTWHGFTYPGQGESYLSVKFHAEGAPPLPDAALFAPKTGFLASWLACLDTLLAAPATPGLNPALAGLIDSLLVQLLPRAADPAPPPACVRRAQTFIEAHAGQAVTVAQTARAAGVAPGYLATVFRASTGRTVKEAIDHQRLQLARSLLHYSDLNIGQTALQTGFPDIYAFSRFFKRHTGQSPQAFRQSLPAKSAGPGH